MKVRGSFPVVQAQEHVMKFAAIEPLITLAFLIVLVNVHVSIRNLKIRKLLDSGKKDKNPRRGAIFDVLHALRCPMKSRPLTLYKPFTRD